MHVSPLQIFADLDEQHLHLGSRPAQNIGQEHQAQGLDGSIHILEIPHAYCCVSAKHVELSIASLTKFLELLLPGPRVCRPLIFNLHDVLEPSLEELLFISQRRIQRRTELPGGLEEEIVPL